METSVLILAAGYGTRLSQDIEQAAPKYDHLKGLPKALLPIGSKPLLSYWIHLLEEVKAVKISKVTVISNAKFYKQFENWLTENHAGSALEIEILNDETTCNENRLGCCKSIQFGLKQSGHDENKPCLVIASDILFPRPYQLDTFFRDWKHDTTQVYVYKCKDELIHKHGILEIDESGSVTSFLEKPQLGETTSRLACPCFYLFETTSINALEEFLSQKDVPDSSGHFLRYLVEKVPGCCITVKHIESRYDIGNLKSYVQCNDEF